MTNPAIVNWTRPHLVMAIGQGFLLTTPMQLALLYGAIANGGKFIRPRVVLRVEHPGGGIIKKVDPRILGELDFNPQTISFIQTALEGAVQELHGTGRAAQLRGNLRGIRVAGKTGTAQVVRAPEDEEEEKTLAPFITNDNYEVISEAQRRV